jgi:hypothetical protein
MEAEKRKEQRISIDVINLPFLGSKEEDHLCFQYLLVDVSKSGVRIAIPKWVVNRELVRKGDIINFHIPFEVEKNFYDQGSIVRSQWDDVIQSEIYGVSVENSNPLPYPEPRAASENIIAKLLKDSMLLKKGVYIYLGHLIPFFSRITQYSQSEYPQLKAVFLEDVRGKISEHHLNLQELYEKAKREVNITSDIPKVIDLEELRAIIESEIYVEVFNIAFSDEHINPYLNAIKKLENRLYSNYNMIVMLYVNSLENK